MTFWRWSTAAAGPIWVSVGAVCGSWPTRCSARPASIWAPPSNGRIAPLRWRWSRISISLVGAVRGGDLTGRIDETGKTGFYRQLATGFNALVGELSEMVGDVARALRALAEGDLSARIENQYRGAFGELRMMSMGPCNS